MSRALDKTLLRRTARAGVLIAAAMILSWLEAILPFNLGIPGVKLGLCHVVTVFALYRLTTVETVSVTLLRVVLTSLLFGSPVSALYSLSGAALSILVMLLLRRLPAFSPIGISLAGGVAHNIGQLGCAAILMDTVALGWYLPVLLVAGTVSGAVIGTLGGIAVKRVKNRFF